MIELGKKNEIFGADQLQLLNIKTDTSGRPVEMPKLTDGHSVVCCCDRWAFVSVYVCESLEDMQELYNAYLTGSARAVKWYSAKDAGFILTG